MKKVLFITFHFAPFNDTGAYRSLKFVKYLPQHGWLPVVLTCKNPGQCTVDKNLTADIPAGVRIYKTRWLDLRALFGFRFLQSWRGVRPQSPSDTAAAGARGYSLNFISRLYRAVMKPDDKITWIPGTVLKAVRLCKKENIQAIYTTSPPHSIHLAGLLVAKLTGLPWYVDFRDPWLDHALDIDNNNFSRFEKKLFTFYERQVVENARAVIANTTINKQSLLARYPQVAPERFATIYNGFDPDDVPQQNGRHRVNGKVVFAYAGTLYDGMAEEFFQRLNAIVRHNESLADKIRIRIIGALEVNTQHLLRQLPLLAAIVSIENRLPKAVLFRELAACDVLLYFTYPSRHALGWVPSKLYDYLALNKPIFCLGQEGEAAQIIRQSGVGFLVDPSQLEATIAQLVASFSRGEVVLQSNRNFIQQFHRKKQCEQLAQLFNPVS